MWSSDYGLNTRGSHILYIYIYYEHTRTWQVLQTLASGHFLQAASLEAKFSSLITMSIGVTPPTNSGIMDFNCNFPAKIAQQPRDQNHKQFERPNLLNPNFSDVEPKYEITLGAAYLEPGQIYSVGACRKKSWIQSLLGKGKGSSAGMSLLRDTFFSDKFC